MRGDGLVGGVVMMPALPVRNVLAGHGENQVESILETLDRCRLIDLECPVAADGRGVEDLGAYLDAGAGSGEEELRAPAGDGVQPVEDRGSRAQDLELVDLLPEVPGGAGIDEVVTRDGGVVGGAAGGDGQPDGGSDGSGDHPD